MFYIERLKEKIETQNHGWSKHQFVNIKWQNSFNLTLSFDNDFYPLKEMPTNFPRCFSHNHMSASLEEFSKVYFGRLPMFVDF